MTSFAIGAQILRGRLITDKKETMNPIPNISPISLTTLWLFRRSAHVLGSSCALLFLFAGSSLRGQTNEFFDDFSTGNDSRWNHYDFTQARLPNNAHYTFPNGQYHMHLDPSPNLSTIGVTRAVAFPGSNATYANNYTNFTVSADITAWDARIYPAGNSRFGMLARGNTLGLGTTDGYLLVLSQSLFSGYAPSGVLTLGKLTNEVFDTTFRWAYDTGSLSFTDTLGSVVNLDTNKTYRLVFSGDGDLLVGQLIDLSNMTVAGSVWGRDSTYPSGAVGLFGFDGLAFNDEGNGTVDVTFDNFSASGVPVTPQIQIDRAVVLAWPATGANYVVESAATVNGPWNPLGVTPTVAGNEATVFVKAAEAGKFFRLSKP